MNSPNNFPFTCDGESQVVDDLVSGGEPLDLVVFGWRNNPWFVKMTVGFDISWHRPHSPYSQDDLTDKAFNPDGKRKTKAFGVVEGNSFAKFSRLISGADETIGEAIIVLHLK